MTREFELFFSGRGKIYFLIYKNRKHFVSEFWRRINVITSNHIYVYIYIYIQSPEIDCFCRSNFRHALTWLSLMGGGLMRAFIYRLNLIQKWKLCLKISLMWQILTQMSCCSQNWETVVSKKWFKRTYGSCYFHVNIKLCFITPLSLSFIFQYFCKTFK